MVICIGKDGLTVYTADMKVAAVGDTLWRFDRYRLAVRPVKAEAFAVSDHHDCPVVCSASELWHAPDLYSTEESCILDAIASAHGTAERAKSHSAKVCDALSPRLAEIRRSA